MKEIANKQKKNTLNKITFNEKKKNITSKKIMIFYYNK